MTPNEFKLKFPQYSHLEGDDLWDKMTDVVLQQDKSIEMLKLISKIDALKSLL